MDPADMLPGPAAYQRTEAASDGTFAGRDRVDQALEPVLDRQGIDELYQHQAEALEAVQDGSNVVVATATASGKSLIYQLEALRRAKDGNRTLYLAPTNALVNDQEEAMRQAAASLHVPGDEVQRYTGQLSKHAKRQVRERQPHILLSNVDMLHMSLLPYATRSTWDWFFSSLDLVVIDELHYYRGVLGSQVAMVFRRLQRLLDEFDVDPSFIAASATIGNPADHAAAVTGVDDWHAVTEDTSASGKKHWLVLDNDDSPHPKAKRLSQRLVTEDKQTLTFARARQLSERYIVHLERDLLEQGEETKAKQVEAYHAALNDEQRTELEQRIKKEDVMCVWSTNALELGVDIGTLDAVVLDGYPGSRMNLHQQAGRAGRATDESFVYLVPGTDQLDQYLVNHPEELFEEPEDARVNPGNVDLLAKHLELAAREQPLTEDDTGYFPNFDDAVEQAVNDGLVERRGDAWRATEGRGMPFQIRNVVDRSIALVDGAAGERLTELNYESAITDAYPGALYLHAGDQYRVETFDRDEDVAYLSPVDGYADYFTDPVKDKQVRINEELEREEVGDIAVMLADVTVDGSVVGYQRKDRQTQETIEQVEYQPDEQLPFEFRTKAIVLTFDTTPAVTELKDGLHAAEHTMIGVIPLHVLCDRRDDLGGLSTPLHPETGKPTIFIHEGHPGGVGLVDDAHEILGAIVEEARQSIVECDCSTGCGSCIYSPTCGNANRHLDKDDGVAVLEQVGEELDFLDD